jgi:hypothetical protein
MGQSARAFCREQGGGKRSIFYKRRNRSLERIAAFLDMQRAGKMTALTSPPDKSAAVGHEEAKQHMILGECKGGLRRKNTWARQRFLSSITRASCRNVSRLLHVVILQQFSNFSSSDIDLTTF